MSVKAITPDYVAHTENRDLPELYHGNLMVYVYWEEHLSFVAAVALPLPPATPFGVIREAVGGIYGPHPDWEKIDWATVEWTIDGKAASPDPATPIGDLGIAHKSMVKFRTPGLNGWKGTGN
jgi:phenol hydroxylase P4 protein